MYVKLDSENRIVNMLDEPIDYGEHDDEGKAMLHEMFPVYIENPDTVRETAVHDIRDFVVTDGIAKFDPTPESRKKIQAEFKEVIKQAKVDGLIDYLENGVLTIDQP